MQIYSTLPTNRVGTYSQDLLHAHLCTQLSRYEVLLLSVWFRVSYPSGILLAQLVTQEGQEGQQQDHWHYHCMY